MHDLVMLWLASPVMFGYDKAAALVGALAGTAGEDVPAPVVKALGVFAHSSDSMWTANPDPDSRAARELWLEQQPKAIMELSMYIVATHNKLSSGGGSENG